MLDSPFKKPIITPPPEHPRLMLRRKDLERVRENLGRSENRLAVEIYEELLGTPVRGAGATPEYGTYNLGEYLAAEAYAFRALLSGRADDARTAVDAVDLLLDAFDVPAGNMKARWGGHLIFLCAETYDWCYRFIPDSRKVKWISRCEEIASRYFEMGYPPAKQAALSGHGTEAQLLRDLLAFSIAVYDERPDIYEWCAGRIFDEYVPNVRLYLAGGAHPQGPTYGSYRWAWLAWAELLFRSVSGGAVFGCLEPTAEWLFYMTRPDGEAMRLGDDFNEVKDEYNRKAPFTVPFFLAWALTGRDVFRRSFDRGLCREYLLPSRLGMDFYDESSWGEAIFSPVSMLIFDRSASCAEAEAVPPVCRHFGYPVGQTVYKSGQTHIFMKAGEFWGSNHDHLDAGCFQIYSGAPLFTDSGVYDSYHTNHRKRYTIQTVAHNCLTVEPPEGAGQATPEGGQRLPGGGREPKTPETLFCEEYRAAFVLSHSESDDGCSMEIDLTPAYRHSCASVTRRMEYDAVARVFRLRDAVRPLKKGARCAGLLHVQTEPRIDGRTVTVKNGPATAVVRVLSPADAVIRAVGGPGREFVSEGVNYPPERPNFSEAGWGRIEVVSESDEPERVIEIEIVLR